MANNTNWDEKRTKPRIAWSFVAKYRPSQDESRQEWEVSCIQDISQGGCSFTSRFPFDIEGRLDIEIQFPALEGPMRFVGVVKRCDKRASLYFIGVEFIEMDEVKKNIFFQTLDFFLKKKR